MSETAFHSTSPTLLTEAYKEIFDSFVNVPDETATSSGSFDYLGAAAYTAEISRNNPACFLFMIDQSSSMKDPWGGKPGINKSDTLSSIINRLLQNLVLKCTKEDTPRDYFEIGVIGYGRQVGSAFLGHLAGKELVPVSDLANFPARMEQKVRQEDNGTGFMMDRPVRFPIWVDAVADGGTPMCQAFGKVADILTHWVKRHPDSFPPVVFHLTDGASTDGDPTDAVEKLKSIHTNDGHVLLFNAHVSSRPADPQLFPSQDEGMQSDYSRWLFHMSSELTTNMRMLAESEGHQPREGARGFVFNADPGAITHFLDIGTRPQNFH